MDDSANLSPQIEQAFGPQGLGILTVKGVPGYPALRRRLLLLAERLAALPADITQRLEDPDSLWNIGWSRGREALADGQLDVHKASFYANPLLDCPDADAIAAARFPSYCRPNLWPDEELPELRAAFRDLGVLIISVGLLLAGHCDRYAAARAAALLANPEGHTLGKADAGAEGDWCGWHRDHGSLTGLTAALFVRRGQEVAAPDARAGLHVRDRGGRVVRAALPADHLAFQMGEAMQVQSGGLLQATPHCVRAAGGPSAAGVARNAFAVFMQPRWDEPLEAPAGAAAEQVGIPRWRPGLTFGEFAELTVRDYYQPAAPAKEDVTG
ncbi:hypothetical protein WJX81_004585 [Elliptochloris bilobata]|uniref:Fe2OG dioxygenase domain-containing protein n=1 Tax=Elliptochloris bilobata TaxID=381761 RepID=A0AAW1R386_9CHLO